MDFRLIPRRNITGTMVGTKSMLRSHSGKMSHRDGEADRMTVDVLTLSLSIVAIAASIASVALNYNTTNRATRRDFALWLAAISVVPVLVTANDFIQLFGGREWPVPLLYLSWLVLAWPFYRSLCRRIFYGGLPRWLAVIGLIPYVNFLFSLSLLFVSSQPIPSPEK